MCETLGKAEVWLIRTFWDLEIPRPTPPNFIYVGGLHCKPANQLPEVQILLPAALMIDKNANVDDDDNDDDARILSHLLGLGGIHAKFRRCRCGGSFVRLHSNQLNNRTR